MNRTARSARKLLVAATAIVGLRATTVEAQLTSALPAPGQVGLTWFGGGDLVISGVSKNAAHFDYLYLFSVNTAFSAIQASGKPWDPSTLQGGIQIATNAGVDGSQTELEPFEFYINAFDLAAMWGPQYDPAAVAANGIELVFGLYNLNLDHWNFTGGVDADRNAEVPFFSAGVGVCTPETVAVTDRAPICQLRFEDLSKEARDAWGRAGSQRSDCERRGASNAGTRVAGAARDGHGEYGWVRSFPPSSQRAEDDGLIRRGRSR